MRIGLREANQRFSKVIRAVMGGTEVVLTQRGTPIAVIKPIQVPERTETVARALEAAGVLRLATTSRPLPRWTPRPIKGPPLSRTLREERDAS